MLFTSREKETKYLSRRERSLANYCVDWRYRQQGCMYVCMYARGWDYKCLGLTQEKYGSIRVWTLGIERLPGENHLCSVILRQIIGRHRGMREY